MTFQDARGQVNINTFVMVAGFALTLATGVMVYGSERAENRLKHAETARLVDQLRADSAQREARIRALELGAGRADEKLTNILSVLGRIERRLDQQEERP